MVNMIRSGINVSLDALQIRFLHLLEHVRACDRRLTNGVLQELQSLVVIGNLPLDGCYS